jgi:hypothetical protein
MAAKTSAFPYVLNEVALYHETGILGLILALNGCFLYGLDC